MATMRVAQVSRPGGPLELVERPIPDPGPGSVRIKVQACGICHSDAMTKEGLWPGITFPRVPGHEVIGVIDAAGRVGDDNLLVLARASAARNCASVAWPAMNCRAISSARSSAATIARRLWISQSRRTCRRARASARESECTSVETLGHS